MLDNPPDASVKRYAPPSQRNRGLGRRRSGSGDRLERINQSYGNEVEKNQASHSRNFPVASHSEAGKSNDQNDQSTIITLEGCSSGNAARILNERWRAAMSSCNDPSLDSSERPVIYSGATGSSWGQTKLPQQMDFLAELRRKMQNANISTKPGAPDRSGF